MSYSVGFKLCIDKLSGSVVHIDQVEEGYEHGICPQCRAGLVASNWNKASRKTATYFRHKTKASCHGETLIHRFAKQVIEEEKYVHSPLFQVSATARDSNKNIYSAIRIINEDKLVLYRIEPEHHIENNDDVRKPDIYCYTERNNSPLAIEIHVHNPVSEEKKCFFQKLDLTCLEISIGDLPTGVIDSLDEFKKYLLVTAPRKWIYHSQSTELKRLAQEEANEKAAMADEAIKKAKAEKRRKKKKWREENKLLIDLIEKYMDDENKAKAQAVYDRRIQQADYLPADYHKELELKGSKASTFNIPVKGELGFNCHRTLWQWHVYNALVNNAKGYGNSDLKIKSPLDVYELIKDELHLNKICSETARILNGTVEFEVGQPEELMGLKQKEWKALPKPVCVIRRYIRELEARGIISHITGDTYIRASEKDEFFNY